MPALQHPVRIPACSRLAEGLTRELHRELDGRVFEMIGPTQRRILLDYFDNPGPADESKDFRVAWNYFEEFLREISTYPKCAMPPPYPASHCPEPLNDTRSYIESWNPRYKRVLSELSNRIDPMHPNCKAAVCMPIAASEWAYVYRALECYARQSMKDFELVAFVNAVTLGKEAEVARSNMAMTLSEIARFQKDYPHAPVRLVCGELTDPEVANIGMIRSIAMDLAALRYASRNLDQQLYLVSADADLRGLPRNQLEDWTTWAETNDYYFDACRGSIRHSPECLPNDPLLYASARFSELLWSASNYYSPCLSGASFLVCVGSYSCVAGIPACLKLGEDNSFGSILRYWREGQKRVRAIFPESPCFASYTSVRRAAAALDLDHTFESQWEDVETTFDELDLDIRTRGEGRARTAPYSDRASFVSACERDMQRSLDRRAAQFLSTPPGALFATTIKRALDIDISVDTGKLRICNPVTFTSALRDCYLSFCAMTGDSPRELPQYLCA